MAVHMGIEYRQWQFSKQLHQTFKQLLKSSSAYKLSHREVTNTLERWILSLQQNVEQFDLQLPLFPVIEEDNAANEQLVKELSQIFRIRPNDKVRQLLRQLLRKIEEFRTQCHRDGDPAIPNHSTERDNDGNSKLVVGDFQSGFNPRIRQLLDRFGLPATACMMLRYESVGNGSYQWGDPKSVHRLFYTEFGGRYEGFASPLNSRFLGQEGARFCSLFPDTDRVFGSLGNFFEIDLMQHQGGWTSNPPFIESVLIKTARRVVAALEKGANSYFLLNYPHWVDSDGWNILNESRFLVARFDVDGGHFLVQDAYGDTLRPQMRLSHFVVGRLPVNCPNVLRIKEAIYRD